MPVKEREPKRSLDPGGALRHFDTIGSAEKGVCRPVDVYQLQVFLAVYRNRSFSRAAEELHLTQPSVSTHIKRLEETLGVPLFDRIGRKTAPTKAGKLLSVRAEELLHRLEDIRREVVGQANAIKGLITMASTSIPGSYVIPALASEFKKTHPEVFFQVLIKESGEVVREIRDGEFLLGLVDEKTSDPDLICHHEIEDELILATPPGMVKEKAVSPLKLMNIPLLIREEGSEARKSMDKQHLLHKVSLKALNITAILGSTDSVREAVKAGLGAAILSKFVVRDDLRAGAVEQVRIKGVRMRRRFYLISHRKRSLPQQYRAFVSFLKRTEID